MLVWDDIFHNLLCPVVLLGWSEVFNASMSFPCLSHKYHTPLTGCKPVLHASSYTSKKQKTEKKGVGWGGGGLQIDPKRRWKQGNVGESWSQQKRENTKAKDRKGRTRLGRRSCAGRFTAIFPLTVLLAIRCKTFSLTLINVTTYSWFINTSIIRLSITLPGGLAETESYSSCSSPLMHICFSSSLTS